MILRKHRQMPSLTIITGSMIMSRSRSNSVSSSVDDLLDTGVSHQDRQDLKGMDFSEGDNLVLDESGGSTVVPSFRGLS